MHAADEWGVDIITMSLGFEHHIPEIEAAINHASSKNIIMFASASNDGSNKYVAFPAREWDRVICIYSTDGNGIPSGFNPPLLDSSKNFSTLGEAVESA